MEETKDTGKLHSPVIESNNIINENPTIEKMDSLIMKLQEHTKLNLSSIIKTDKNIENKMTETKIIKAETPEYYANEQIKFLNDQCQEKDKKIKTFNTVLNISVITNFVLISYILGTWFY